MQVTSPIIFCRGAKILCLNNYSRSHHVPLLQWGTEAFVTSELVEKDGVPVLSLSPLLVGWCLPFLRSLKSCWYATRSPEAGATRVNFSVQAVPFGVSLRCLHCTSAPAGLKFSTIGLAVTLIQSWNISWSVFGCVSEKLHQSGSGNKGFLFDTTGGDVTLQRTCKLDFCLLTSPLSSASNFCLQVARRLLHLQPHVWLTDGKKIETTRKTGCYLYNKSKAKQESPRTSASISWVCGDHSYMKHSAI